MPVILIASAAVLLYCGIEGARHGVVRRAVEIVGLLLIFLFASQLAHAVEPWLARTVGISGRAAFFSAWTLVLVGGVVGVRMLAAGLGKLARFSIVGWLDRGGGAVLGLSFGAVLVSCALNGLLAAPVGDDLKDELRESTPTAMLLGVAPSFYDAASRTWKGGRFRDLFDEHVEPTARGAVEGIKAYLDDVRTNEDASGDSRQ